MATLASSLLDFILDLLRDDDAAAEFAENPQRALADAGLDDVCPADLANLRLAMQEYPPAGVSLANVVPAGQVAAATSPVAAAQVVAATPTAVSPATLDEDSVVNQLHYIQQTFTYTSETTVEVRDNVWAGKDVYQIFGDDAVVATGDGIAAGDDIDDVEIDRSVEIEDSFNIDDSFNPENSGNTQTGTGNVNGHGADVDLDNSGNSVDDSTGVVFGDGGEIENATTGNGNVVGNRVEVEDSFNDNSDNSTELDIDDSFNEQDNSTTTEVDVDVDLENSFNDNSRELEVDDSFNDNSTTVSDNFSDNFSDNAVAVGEDDATATA